MLKKHDPKKKKVLWKQRFVVFCICHFSFLFFAEKSAMWLSRCTNILVLPETFFSFII